MNLHHVPRGLVLLAALALLNGLIGACDDAPDPDEAALPSRTAEPGDSAATVLNEAAGDGYRAFFYGILEDTLAGPAQFGQVLERRTGIVTDVIELPLPDRFMGGLYLSKPAREPVTPGTHAFVDAAADSTQMPDGWRVVFRRGLSTRLLSTDGQLQLETVTDSLWAGTFDVQLHGTVADATGRVLGHDVRARGRFRAEPGNVGFLLGL